MRFLKGLIHTLLFINSTVALSPAASSLQRRVPQRYDDEDDYRDGDGRDDDRFRTSTVYGGGSARTTTIRQQPPGGRTTTITGRPVTSTVTRRTTVTIAGPSPAPNNGGGPRGPSSHCPQQWFQISNELNTMFGAGAGCTKDAHTAIRAIFHDCFPVGGCDGSLAMQEELSRPANQIMASSINKFKSLAQKYRVSMADMFAFAGSHAVISCPGGPVVKTYIGRRDANRAAPDGQLPPHFALARDSLEAFRYVGSTLEGSILLKLTLHKSKRLHCTRACGSIRGAHCQPTIQHQSPTSRRFSRHYARCVGLKLLCSDPPGDGATLLRLRYQSRQAGGRGSMDVSVRH
jgi:hypothetical protein